MKKLLCLLLLFAGNCVGEEKNQENMMNETVVVFETSKGTIELKLFPQSAPKTVENFTKLADSGYYNGVPFHRVIEKFMIQGGDPTGTGAGGKSSFGKEFEDEFDPKLKFDKPGILAMANRGPNTNGSQFFITTAPATWLNGKHTIFGEVSKGYDVVQKIETTPKGAQDRPKETIEIKKAYTKGKKPQE